MNHSKEIELFIEISRRLNSIEQSLRNLSAISGRLEEIDKSIRALEEQIKIQNGRVRSLEEWKAGQIAIGRERARWGSIALSIINNDVFRWAVAIAVGLMIAGLLSN